MRKPAVVAAVLAGAAATAIVPTTSAAAHAAAPAYDRCVPVQPASDFYEAGRIASEPVTVPRSGCTTIAVSHIRDAADPTDRCQTFLLAFLRPEGGDPTYTEPVEACSTTPSQRTVLATDVPNGTVFRVIYQVDYIDPQFQVVRYKVWR